MKILFIRHGMTEGNKNKKYIGVTDEHLCPEGREELEKLKENMDKFSGKVISSPLIRCIETARILFPDSKIWISDDLAEMNFGIFEGRAFKGDLEKDPCYREWTDGMCEGKIPEGESKAEFTGRCIRGFFDSVKDQQEELAFVVHGGTIMAILSELAFPEKPYYDWHTENGRGYAGEWDGKKIIIEKKL